jgi:hypothetical protein
MLLNWPVARGAPLRLEPLAESRPRSPAVVGPGAAAADPRKGTVPVHRPLRRRQIGIVAAGQLLVIPIAAPFDDVTVHVVQPPRIGGVTADFGGPLGKDTAPSSCRIGPNARQEGLCQTPAYRRIIRSTTRLTVPAIPRPALAFLS